MLIIDIEGIVKKRWRSFISLGDDGVHRLFYMQKTNTVSVA